jgi:hypothetical protein
VYAIPRSRVPRGDAHDLGDAGRGPATEDFTLWGMSQKMGWSTRLYYLLMVAAVVYGAWLIVRAMRRSGPDSG